MAEGLRVAKVIEIIEDKNKGIKGISFYCPKRHEFMFIENVKQQTTQYSALKQPKKHG